MPGAFPREGRRPKAFQVVLLARIRPHDVDDDVEVIQHLPGRPGAAFHPARAHLMFLPELVDDFVDDGAQMRLAPAGGDDKIVGDGGQLAHVKYDGIFGLFIFRQLAAQERQFLRNPFFAEVSPPCPEDKADYF